MRTIGLLLALATTTAGFGQVKGYQGNLGGTIGVGIPQGEFADTWDKGMFTFGGHMTLPSRLLPFQWGFAFGYGIMGTRARPVEVSQPELGTTEGRMAVRSKVLSYHPMLRFSPLHGKVRPYVDGLVGVRHFSTRSTITVDGLHEPLVRERYSSDLAWSTGWAAGLMVNLGTVGYIEGRVERFYSGRASYVDPGSIAIDDQGVLDANTLESGTGTLNLLVGVGFRF